MRCPKCGYISFDHLDTCGKCNKDLSAISESFDGGLYNTVAPLFLVIDPEADVIGDQFLDSETDMVADQFDLAGDDVLSLDEDESEIEFFMADEEDGVEDDAGFEIEEPDVEPLDADDEIVLDFDQDIELGDIDNEDDTGFEIEDPDVETLDADDEIVLDVEQDDIDNEDDGFIFDEPPEDEIISISLPDELADISDLSPPVVKDDGLDISVDTESPVEIPVPREEIDMEIGDINLDLSSFEELTGPDGGSGGDSKLSLGDVDSSRTVAKEVDTPVVDDLVIDMDSELDFELDLGGITLRKESETI